MQSLMNNSKILSAFPGSALGMLINAMNPAIAKSFEEQKMRNPTRDEIKRRVNIIVDNALMLRHDKKWGLQRICDTIPEILRTTLVAGRWEPSEKDRQCWMPGDGA